MLIPLPLSIIQTPVAIYGHAGKRRSNGEVDRHWRDHTCYLDGSRYEGSRLRIYRHYIVPQILEGKNPPLFPPEFIQYLLDKSEIEPADFNKKLGCGPNYFSINVFNSLANDAAILPKPLQEKMAALTGTDVTFWQKRNYKASDAENLSINMEADISPVVAKWSYLSHHQKLPESIPKNDIDGRTCP